MAGRAMHRNSPPAFQITFGVSPYAHEPESDEDSLQHEHDVFEHEDGDGALHLPRFNSKTEIRKHVECLKAEISYYEALLAGNEQAASKARDLLCNTMSDGDED